MPDLYQRADSAAQFILYQTPLRPRIGLILGSGLGAFADTLADATRVPYSQIPAFPHSTAIGHAILAWLPQPLQDKWSSVRPTQSQSQLCKVAFISTKDIPPRKLPFRSAFSDAWAYAPSSSPTPPAAST